MCFCGLERWWWRGRVIWLGWWWAGTLRCEPLQSGSTKCIPILRLAAMALHTYTASWKSFKPTCLSLSLSSLSQTQVLAVWECKKMSQFCDCICMQGTKAEKTPHYKVLFSGPGPSSLFVGYLPQTQLERITGMRVCTENHSTSTHTFSTCWDSLLDASSRTFPPWRITSHILMGSGSSCSPGSERSIPRTTKWTPDWRLAVREHIGDTGYAMLKPQEEVWLLLLCGCFWLFKMCLRDKSGLKFLHLSKKSTEICQSRVVMSRYKMPIFSSDMLTC